MEKINIRFAKLEDLKRISYLTKIAWKKPYKKFGVVNMFHEEKNFKEKFLKREVKILVAVYEDKIIGAIRYKLLEKREIYFSKLVVLYSFRKRGVGATLLNRLESIAKKTKIDKISLDVMEEKFLVPYYQKFGYKIVNRIKHNDHHDIYMSKKII